jgi:single-strand DNA-binding protein
MRAIRGTVNRVELLGWAGDAPEHRSLASGVDVASFRVATRRIGPRGEDGERSYETEWTTIEAWERLAVQVSSLVHRGSRVWVSGSLQTQSWEDRDSGARRWRVLVRAEEVLILDGRDEPAAAEAPDAGD